MRNRGKQLRARDVCEEDVWDSEQFPYGITIYLIRNCKLFAFLCTGVRADVHVNTGGCVRNAAMRATDKLGDKGGCSNSHKARERNMIDRGSLFISVFFAPCLSGL